MKFLGGLDSKESACNAGDLGLRSGSGRSPGEGYGNPIQSSYLENPHGQRSPGRLQIVHEVAKSQTQPEQLSNSVDFIRTTFTFCSSNIDLLGRGVGVGSHCFLMFLINFVLFNRIALEFALLGTDSLSMNNQSLLCVGFCL